MKNKTQTIQVLSVLDVIMARMQVRELARARGFNMADQARISLAASSMANAIGLGEAHQGEIILDCLNDGPVTGVRVICIRAGTPSGNASSLKLGDTRWMVDELTVETLASNGVKVTAIQWNGKH